METKEIINKAFDKYLNSVQTDKGLGELADIKVLLEEYYRNIEIRELSEVIEEIEEKCNTKNPFIKRIKSLIKNYYEEVGRNDGGFLSEIDRKKVLEKIEKVLEEANIPSNYEVVSRLKLN